MSLEILCHFDLSSSVSAHHRMAQNTQSYKWLDGWTAVGRLSPVTSLLRAPTVLIRFIDDTAL